MSRSIDLSQPLSDEDRQYLLDRGHEQRVAALDAKFAGEDADPSIGLPAGVGDTLPHEQSPDAQVPPADGASTEPTGEGQAAAEAFNGSQADAGDGDDEPVEEPASPSKRKK